MFTAEGAESAEEKIRFDFSSVPTFFSNITKQPVNIERNGLLVVIDFKLAPKLTLYKFSNLKFVTQPISATLGRY